MPTTPSKEAQQLEAAGRQAAGHDPSETTLNALETVGDVGSQTGAVAAPQTQAAPVAEPAAPLPPAKSVYDNKRDEINARFRTARTEQVETEKDDISEFARSNGMPPEFQQAAEPEPEPVAGAEQEPVEGEVAAEADTAAPAPRTVTIKVNGKDIVLTEDELIAKAQIAVASEDVLEHAKSQAREINDLLARTRDTVARGDHPALPHQQGRTQPGAHQTGEQPDPTQPGTTSATNDLEHQQDPLARLIETIQFGDPEEAKNLLAQTIANGTTAAVQSELLAQRFRDEGARAAKTLKDFEVANPELAKDPRARAVIETDIFEQQTADLKAIGLDPARIRPDGMPPTPGDIAEAHRYYRAQGMNVSSPATMLEKATANFLEWKGVAKPKPAADPPPAPTTRVAPVVELTVDRQNRRAAVPQQPSRSAAPRPTPQPAPQPRDRSSIVESMKRNRAQPRGQILGT